MDRPFLSWTYFEECYSDFSCFACSDSLVLMGNVNGEVSVMNQYKFSLYSDPIRSIHHIKANIFLIIQNFSSIVSISNTYTLINTVKHKLKGFYSNFCWTSNSVFNIDLNEIYKIEEKEGEITQVCPFEQGIIVSTLIRSVIINKGSVVQIGKKERNGWFGACELNGCVFASRPLGNIWEANSEGIVMLTTNYKIKSEKINFGMLFPVNSFILSINKDFSMYYLIDPVRKNIVFNETLKEKGVYYNENIQKIFKIEGNKILQSKIISCLNHFNQLLEINIQDSILFCLEIYELQNLDVLRGLCEKVFTQNHAVEADIFKNFSNLIERLETNMNFPMIRIENEANEHDELFDEFLKVATFATKKKKSSLKIDERIKKYYKINFSWQIVANFLMFVILNKNSDLRKIQRFLKIARKSLDYEKFCALSIEEKLLLTQIENTL